MTYPRALLTLILTLAFAGAPLVSGDFRGFQSDQLPVPQIDPPIQPEGYAFAIWGLIYLWLVVSAVFGIVARRHDAGWNRARGPLCVSLAVGAPWLAIAQVSAIWATVAIFVMLIGALVALDRAPVRDARWLRRPIAIYAGWLTAASFVSLASTMAGYGIGFGAYGWAFAGIFGALIVSVATYVRAPSLAYLAAVIWALVGIIVANGMDNFLVTATAIGGVAILICVMAVWAPRPPVADPRTDPRVT